MLVRISSLFHFITKQNSILWIYHNLSLTSCWTFGLFLSFCCHEQSCYGFCKQIFVSYFPLCMLGIWLMDAENWNFVWFNVELFYFCIVLGPALMINYIILIALTFSRFAYKFVRVRMSRNFIVIGYLTTFISIEDFCTSHRLWFLHCHGLLFSNNSSESQFDIGLGFLSSEHRVFILNLLGGTDSFWPYCSFSVSQSCTTLCESMDCSTPGFPVLHCLLEFAQTHVHCVNDATQPSQPLLSPSPSAHNLSQYQGLFQWVCS